MWHANKSISIDGELCERNNRGVYLPVASNALANGNAIKLKLSLRFAQKPSK